MEIFNDVMVIIGNLALIVLIPFGYVWIYRATQLYIETRQNEIQKLEQERYNLAQLGIKYKMLNDELRRKL